MIRWLVLVRIPTALLTIAVISVLVFLGIRMLPGNAAVALSPAGASPAAVRQIRHEFHLDEPLPNQYVAWVSNVIRGNLGSGAQTNVSVASELGTRAPATLELAILATIVGVVPGVLLGVLMATRRAGVFSYAGSLVSLLGLSIPSFWLGLLLILAFSVHWQLLPPSGFVPLTRDPVANLEHMIMPVFVLALGFAAVVMRQTRSALLEVLQTDYIRAARAKGLTERRVIWVHGLRNALTSVLTVVGLQLGALISGVVIT